MLRCVCFQETEVRDPITKSHNKSDDTFDKVKIKLYFGGWKSRDLYLADIGTNKVTRHVGDIEIPLPVDYKALMDACTQILLSSTMTCGVDEENHVVTLQTPETAPKPAKRGSQAQMLPVCRPVEKSFRLTTFSDKFLVIVIHKVDEAAISNSYVGGSEVVDELEDPRAFAINRWAARIVVDSIADDVPIKGCSEPPNGSKEAMKAYASSLAEKFLTESLDIPLHAKVKHYYPILDEAYDSFTPEDEEEDPLSPVLPPSKLHLFLSATHNEPNGQPLVQLRLRGEEPVVFRTIEWIKNHRDFIIEVQVQQDCGKHNHLKKGTWCHLKSVVERDGKCDLFLVNPGYTSQEYPIRCNNFCYSDIKSDTDDDDSSGTH